MMEDITMNEIQEEKEEYETVSEQLLQEQVVQDQEETDYTEEFNEIKELLKSISENQVKEIEEYERIYQGSLRTVSNDSVSDGDILDDQHEYLTVSADNIITKKLNDYTVTESYLLIFFLQILFIVFVLIIRKAVYKWK